MRVFYGESKGRNNVESATPVEETPGNTLEIFRGLNQCRGFLGIVLKQPYVLQLLPNQRGIRIELLDSSVPSIEWCETNSEIAESLIEAAASGSDVLQVARQLLAGWQHLKLM